MISALKTQFSVAKQGQFHSHYENQGNLLCNSKNPTEAFKLNIKSVILLPGVRESKQTQSTDLSYLEEQENITLAEAGQNLLDFTFNQSDIQRISSQQEVSLKNKYKYSNKSIQPVIFYALLFNQFHLQEVKENMPNIASSNLKSYNLIKEGLLKYDQIVAKKQLQDYIFAQSAFRIIENKTLSLKDRKSWLKTLIDKIQSSIIVEILLDMEQQFPSTVKTFSQNKKQTKHQIKLQEFANFFGIRIKYQSQFKICSYGKKSSNICISVREQAENQLFHLKKVSCQEDRA